MYELKTGIIPTKEKLVELYSSVEWTAYTGDPERLYRGVKNSPAVYTAWEGDQLVGLLRAVGDGETILYVQDILVRPDFQGFGIGKALLCRVEKDYENVRQKVLLADRAEKLTDFYCARGWYPADTWGCTAFLKFDY